MIKGQQHKNRIQYEAISDRQTFFSSHMLSHVHNVNSFGNKIYVPSMGNFSLISHHILAHYYYSILHSAFEYLYR